MIRVHLTRHLFSFFPQLDGRVLEVQAETAAGVVEALEALAPGIRFYLCDELGRLRTHVNLFIGTRMLKDRRALTDPVAPGDAVHILQALSGG